MLREDLEIYLKRRCSRLDVFVGFLKVSGFRALALYRLGHWLHCRNRFVLAALVTRLIRFTCNMDIELGAVIGRRVRFPHPFAIVIGGRARIGDDCTIMQCVTLGGNQGKIIEGRGSQPQLGSGVFVGPGAKLLGPVVVGDDAKIGANSVVLRDIPAGALAVGIPAVVKEGEKERSRVPVC